MSNISTPAGRQLLQWGIRKVVLLLVIVTAFAGLFGCSGKPEPPAEDLLVVSTSCGHMSRTESYSFSAIRKDGEWMFSTRCYADREKFYVELEDCPMTDEEAGELLRIVAEEDLIHTVHSFRKPLLAHIFPPRDAAMDSTLLRFADGTEYDGEVSIGNDLTAFFYRLAEQYGREAAQAILSSGEELPQAVVCGNDGIALGVCSVFRENGIRIPEQVSVSGFDNMFEARNSVPRLTTVEQYNREMNSIRPREYDGSHIVFAGMNPEISLREHQRNAIAHVLYGGDAHCSVR